MKILVVDDDQEIVNLVKIYLEKENYDVIEASNGQEALEIYHDHLDIDLIVLDIMMPKVDGNQVLQQLRDQRESIPVIMLSAKSSDHDKIESLGYGADDYLTKPFNPLELVARVNSLLRRQYHYQEEAAIELTIHSLVIDKLSHEVKTTQGVQIHLTAIEFDILYLLASNLNQTFNAEEIFAKVWGEEKKMSARTVMVHLSHLRDKLRKGTGGDAVIQTIWGVGYKIEK